MNSRLAISIISMALLLPGCATTRFSTPPVNISQEVQPNGSKRCDLKPVANSPLDPERLSTSFKLVENYAASYSCALAETSDGRQWFQIPSHLAAVAGIGAAAFGASKDAALGTGIAAALFNSGNTYWAPQEKAGVIDSALDAILCIKLEAVGIPFIDTAAAPPGMLDGGGNGSTVGVSAERRYYILISGALAQIDRIAGSRLRETGKFDPAGVVAEIEALNAKIQEADEAKKAGKASEQTTKPVDSTAVVTPAPAPPGMNVNDGNGDNGPATAPVGKPSIAQGSGVYLINIDLLQPKMQRCVVRAKL